MLIWRGYKDMSRPRKMALGVVFSLFLFQVAATDSQSQTSEREGRTIALVRVKNNKAISAETVLSKIKTKAGGPFSQATLNDDLKRLYATEYFTDVSISVEDVEGLVVTFVVGEKSVIGDITFKVNRAVRAQKLKSLMKSKAN